MGGTVPLGYDAVNRKLRINAEEAKRVRLLFELYLKLGSIRRLEAECKRLGLRTKLRTMLDGRQCGGSAFSRGHLYLIISNPIYIGRIPHKGNSYEGEHDAIIDAETWDKVQAQLATNAHRKRGQTSSKHPSLLAGLLFTGGSSLHAFPRRQPRPALSLLCGALAADARVRKREFRRASTERNRKWRPDERLAASRTRDRAARLKACGRVPRRSWCIARCPALEAEIARSRFSRARPRIKPGRPVRVAWTFVSHLEIIAALVRRITIAQDQVTIEIKHEGLTDLLLDPKASSPSEKDRPPISIEVPVRFSRGEASRLSSLF